jgi:predicted transcriptional regulator
MFDWEGIAKWLIENYLDFEIVESHPVIDQRELDFKIKKSIGDAFEIFGLVEVKDTVVDQDPVSMLLQKTQEAGYQIPLFVGRTFKNRAKDFAEGKGIILLNEDDIHRITGWKPPTIKRENIRGMILPIKPEFYEKILRKNAKEFIFFKGAPVGKFLSKNDKIFFYIESPRKEISAVAMVVNATIDTPERQWEKYGKKSVFEEQEYWRFARTKRGILAIELEKFKEFTSVKEEELKKIVPQRFLSGAYVDDSIVSKLER